MLSLLVELFSYSFIVRALIVGTLVALCAAFLGVSLVLKRYSMIGDGLSHVGFGALALAMALNLAPLRVSIPLVLIAAFFLLRIKVGGKIKGDAAIALISTSSIAGGVMFISLTSGMNVDVYNYMFGTVLAISREDLYLSVGVAAVVLFLYVFFYNKIFVVTFDEDFAKATGTRTGLYNKIIAFLAALTIVVGMRLIGAMLISGMIVFPALTAMRVFHSFKKVVICSAMTSVISFFLGIVISFAFSTPAGASVILVNLAVFLLFCAFGYGKKRF